MELCTGVFSENVLLGIITDLQMDLLFRKHRKRIT